MRTTLVAWLLVSFTILAAGCGRMPQTHYYVMTPAVEAREDASASRAGLPVVGVRPFRVDPPYDGDRIVYRVGSDSPEVGFYHYHRWAGAPGRILAGAVADRLDAEARRARVELVAPGRVYVAYLSGRVRAIEEVDIPAGQQVRLHLDLRLEDVTGRSLWDREIDASALTRSREMVDLVRAWGGLLDEQVRGVSPSLDEVLADLGGE